MQMARLETRSVNDSHCFDADKISHGLVVLAIARRMLISQMFTRCNRHAVWVWLGEGDRSFVGN